MLRLVVLALGIALAAPAGAQVFKPRGSAAKSDAKRPAAAAAPAAKDDGDDSAKKAPPAKKAARTAPAKKAQAKTKAVAKKADPDFVEITDDDDDE
jgi:hypothetical protein